MTIQRTINGTKFSIKLLPEELIDAYYEQQEKYDIENIVSYAELSDINSCWGYDYSTFIKHKEKMAEKMRKYIDDGMSMSNARQLAVDEVLDAYERTAELVM